MIKKSIFTLLMVTSLISVSACSFTQTSTETSATESTDIETSADSRGDNLSATEQSSNNVAADKEGTHEIIDHAGNTVVLPNKIEKVVIDQVPILSTYMSYFEGDTPYLVGFAGAFKDTISQTVLKDIAPELYEAKDTVYAQSDLNVEEILKLQPDVVFYNANNKEHYELLNKAGIPAVGFATLNADTPADPVTRYKEWMQLLEKVFLEEGKAYKILAKGDEIIADVEARIANIDEAKRPNALILFKYMDKVPQVAGKGIFGDFWLKRLGVTNVASETKGPANVSFEEIYNWNPDIIFLNGPGHLKISVSDVLENKVEGVDFSQLKAVKEKRVYNTTLGMWNWFTPNPDAPLILAWLAYNTYPEEFKDYPLKDTIKDYYKEFYSYELKDEEIEGMILLK